MKRKKRTELKRCLSVIKSQRKWFWCASNESDVWNDTMFAARNGHCFRVCSKVCGRSERHSKWYGICVARKREEAQRTDHIYRTLHIHTNLHRDACKRTPDILFFVYYLLLSEDEKKNRTDKRMRVFQNYHTTTKSECFRTHSLNKIHPLLLLTHERRSLNLSWCVLCCCCCCCRFFSSCFGGAA